ncbi:MAG: response regulator [Nitrospirae bacterium]|uniref:Signal receiver domain-containing protein n=1 Tax=Candidatus Magnetobacterium casense TaxID=1455061 RepID=A0A088F9J1_9BACT|nr:response regulator [Candidatus Magnetobacterium casensis]AIM41283.1 signal receiver domain-containing protein [Candidatus Magnetobacterium casensis]MBF0337221.1 response regulator [Nitrospirota bacterium]
MAFSILVVDDSKTARFMIKKELLSIITEKEVAFTEGASGKEAIDKCLNESYDLIFLDLTMPDITGYDVLETLQKQGVKTNTIVLSADIQPGVKERVKALGAVGYCKKPFSHQVLVTILKENNLL